MPQKVTIENTQLTFSLKEIAAALRYYGYNLPTTEYDVVLNDNGLTFSYAEREDAEIQAIRAADGER